MLPLLFLNELQELLIIPLLLCNIFSIMEQRMICDRNRCILRFFYDSDRQTVSIWERPSLSRYFKALIYRHNGFDVSRNDMQSFASASWKLSIPAGGAGMHRTGCRNLLAGRRKACEKSSKINDFG